MLESHDYYTSSCRHSLAVDLPSDENSIRAMFPTATESDVTLIQGVCNSVSTRAAQLAAAGGN